MKKVTLETVLVTVTDDQEKEVDVYESMDIVKENGEKLSDLEVFDKSALIDDKFTGLSWSINSVRELLKFLGIEYEEKKSSRKEKF